MKIIITESQYKMLIMESASLADDPEFQEMVKEWEGSVIDPKTELHITYDDATGKKIDKGQILVGTLTIGYGTTKDVYPAMSPGEKIGEKKAVDFLKKGIRDNEDIVRDLVKKYDSYPKYVRIALLNAKYRGDLGPDTIELINQGKWGQVSKEYLDHPNYKNPGKYPGVVKRMKSNADAFDKYAKNNDESTDDKIAIVIAEGTIMSGKSTDNTMGSVTINKALEEVRKDKTIKAVILRINSPGGSALASDVMWREVELLKKSKPVIASMSDVAASGGYYIAMGCDTIVAQPNTITGSIGVFGLLFNTQKLLNEKIGITIDRVGTGKYSDLGSTTRPMLSKEEQIIQKGVEDIYEVFTHKAAQGRKMSVEALKNVASGRVWSGVEAKQNGLVDVLGGLETAIEIAKTKAKLKNYQVVYYPENKGLLEDWKEDMESSIEETLLKKQLGSYYPYYQMLKRAEQGDKIQTRMPFDLILD